MGEPMSTFFHKKKNRYYEEYLYTDIKPES